MATMQDKAAELDRSSVPIAVLHQGAFVYANAALLEALGISSLDALPSPFFLDIVRDADRERTRLVLADGLATSPSVETPNSYELTLLGRDDLLAVTAKACRLRFDSEDCVQVSLLPQRQGGPIGWLKTLPWSLYFSIAFVVAFTVLPSLTLTKLQINNAPKVYFPDDEPAVVIDAALRDRFPSDQVIVVLFEGVALFSEGFLKALNEVGDAIAALPEVDDVLSITHIDHIRGSADGFLVERLVNAAELQDSQWREVKDRVLSHRFSNGLLVANDGTALAMVIVPKTIDGSLERLALHQRVLDEIDHVELSGYVSASAGQIALDAAQLESMLFDNMVFIPATVIIGLTMIWLMFKRLLAVVVAGLALGVVTNSTVAAYAILGEPFTLISSIIPPLLSALTIAALIHLFNHMRFASQHGYKGRARSDSAVSEVRRPAFFTAITTAAGLASLATSPIVPIAAFGLISAAGVMLIFFVVVVIAPALLRRWDRKPWPKSQTGLAWMDRLVRNISTFAIRRPVQVVVFVTLGFALAAPQIWRVTVETNLQYFFAPDHELRVATNRVDRLLSGTNTLDVVFESDSHDGLVEPAVLQTIREFQRWAENLPEVDKTLSFADFIEEMHWAFNEEQASFRTIPYDRELISQYLLVYDGADVWDFVDRNLQLTRISMNVNVHSTSDTSALMMKIRDYLGQRNLEPLRVKFDIAGHGRLLADIEDLLISGQVWSLWGAMGLIFLLMLIQWRSLKSTIICMIPNFSPIVLIFVLMGAFGIWLDMATAMIASVAVGIAVDDTIHLYHGFWKRYKAHGNTVLALARTYRQVGRAVTTTTLILSAQFLVLTASAFVPTAHFGLLTSVGLLTAWLFDLLFLPAILMLVFRTRRPKAETAAHITSQA
jgi:predicted RND superfamily exporter protein